MRASRLYTFRATCERCRASVPLTRAEEHARIDAHGSFVCDACKEPPVRLRVIRARPSKR